MYLFSLVTYAQDRSIYIELWDSDQNIIPVWIPRDTSKIDLNTIRVQMPSTIGVFGYNYSTPQDFDLLECILKKELNKDTSYQEPMNDMGIGGNMKIIFFDESFNITDEKYICCGEETADTFKKLLKLKSVLSNQFIFKLFSNYTSY